MPGYALRAAGERNRGCAELGLTAAQRRDRGISLANRSTERHPRPSRAGLRTVRTLAPLSLRSSFIDGSSSVSYLLYWINRSIHTNQCMRDPPVIVASCRCTYLAARVQKKPELTLVTLATSLQFYAGHGTM